MQSIVLPLKGLGLVAARHVADSLGKPEGSGRRNNLVYDHAKLHVPWTGGSEREMRGLTWICVLSGVLAASLRVHASSATSATPRKGTIAGSPFLLSAPQIGCHTMTHPACRQALLGLEVEHKGVCSVVFAGLGCSRSKRLSKE